jgi:hypothetical protein
MSHPDAAYYHAQAFGPRGCLRKVIAGVIVTVTRDCHGHVVVTDDRDTHHDFWGATWDEIVRSMEQYFGVVEAGR